MMRLCSLVVVVEFDGEQKLVESLMAQFMDIDFVNLC